MNPAMTSPGTDRGSFDKFLRWLSPERDAAARSYEEIRKKIVRFFVNRGWENHDELFDRTVDRVVVIVERGDEYSNPLALCFGVAIRVEWEERKKPKPEALGERDFAAPEPDEDKKLHEQRLTCLENCLEELPALDRNLITPYYEGQGRAKINARKHLAAQHGGDNTLRIKVFRIRARLRVCISDCLKRAVN